MEHTFWSFSVYRVSGGLCNLKFCTYSETCTVARLLCIFYAMLISRFNHVQKWAWTRSHLYPFCGVVNCQQKLRVWGKFPSRWLTVWRQRQPFNTFFLAVNMFSFWNSFLHITGSKMYIYMYIIHIHIFCMCLQCFSGYTYMYIHVHGIYQLVS